MNESYILKAAVDFLELDFLELDFLELKSLPNSYDFAGTMKIVLKTFIKTLYNTRTSITRISP